MPTINFSLRDLQLLVKKKLKLEDLQELLPYCKAEFDSYDTDTDEITISYADTNLPYLWSVEGLARALKGVLGKEKGLPKLNLKKSNNKVIVDPSVKEVRPYIAAFIAKGKKINEYFLKQLIQLQEKLSENYGRKRKKLAIGIYPLEKIKFPVYYKAVDPESVSFTPLEFRKDMTPQQILEEHPKGREYAHTLNGLKKYPILIDAEKQVLSFPPIINSETTGKIGVDESELFFEATGTDLDTVLLAANIFSQALSDRGFQIQSVAVNYKGKKIVTPNSFNNSIKLKKQDIQNMLGLDLKDSEVKSLLEKARYKFQNYRVFIPDYRQDILHSVDVIEDIAIMYGYDNIKEEPLKTYTPGSTFALTNFIDKVRELVVGFGYQEIFSSILSNKNLLYLKMNAKDFGTVEIKEYMSETYSCVRTWVLPILMQTLSENKHTPYPQKLFEQGLVTARKGSEIKDYERIAITNASNKADFTQIKQILDALFRALGVRYEIEEVNHDSFLPGRVGRVSVNGVNVAFIGEIAPKVLNTFGLTVPVAALELNLSELFEAIKR